MQSEQSSDFYHGWVIEVVADKDGYHSICYSSSRKRLHCKQAYAHQSEAMRAGRALINYYSACSQLGQFLCELYQSDRISLEEWRSLNCSLFEWQ
ncbi:hypothetical protein [Vacuolonema iberomarrocanum]|uniref:hypothetical protein n=1 Tax=Vacuolonema iberomarrocanum TaxID=3454632 RepID=UPI0019ED579B|nr:hypothetical protein [filamentous cyanobacterium LEGE 07170]